MYVKDKIGRRRWSVEFKRMVVGEASVSGTSTAEVARRYDMNANLLFKWLKDPRYKSAEANTGFLALELSSSPAAIIDVKSSPDAPLVQPDNPLPDTHQFSIHLPCGTKLQCRSDLLPAALNILRPGS